MMMAHFRAVCKQLIIKIWCFTRGYVKIATEVVWSRNCDELSLRSRVKLELAGFLTNYHLIII